MKVVIEDLLKVASNKGYKIFDNDTKDYNLNIWGIRHTSNKPNSFDDLIVDFWKFDGKWNIRTYPATTDPGTYWLQNPQAKLGTAIVKEGQYPGLWKIGLHQGSYKALVQKSPITVIRDNDKDNELDFDSKSSETGIFGINNHRANENGKSVNVDKWSAGCQVMQNREIFNPDNVLVKVHEFDYHLHLCELASERHGNSFTYTLIGESDLLEVQKNTSEPNA